MLKFGCAVLVLALGVLWVSSAGGGWAASGHRQRCEGLEGRTVRANDRVRIVRAARYPDGVDIACHVTTGKRTGIQRVPTQLVGSFVALFFPRPCGGENCEGTGGQLYDLRNGRHWNFSATALRLLPGGKVVFLHADARDIDLQTGQVRDGAAQTVSVFDRRRQYDIASGSGIDASTFTVGGGFVFFMQAGQPRAAPLKQPQ